MMRFMVDFFLVLFMQFYFYAKMEGQANEKLNAMFFSRCIDFPYHFLKLHLIFEKDTAKNFRRSELHLLVTFVSLQLLQVKDNFSRKSTIQNCKIVSELLLSLDHT